MAAWFANYVHAKKFVVLTDIDGVFKPGHVGDKSYLYSEIAASELAHYGYTSVDACFARYVNSVGMNCWVLNAGVPGRVRQVVTGMNPVGTLIKPA